MSRLSFTLCLLGALSASAQLYPVQVTSTLIPPYSVHLHHYAAAGASSFNVLIHPLELDRTDLRVKLRLTIEGAGVTLQTRANYLPPPLILQGGVPEMLTGYDLRHYFNPDNMEILGMTRREFLQGGRLPEGYYTFRVEVLEYTRGVNLSAPNGGQATAWMVLNDPPFINFPFNNEKIQASIPQNIFFNWTPRHLASPNSAFSTEYDFVLIEMYPGHTNPEEAIRSSRSIFSLTTSSPTLVYGIAEPMLTPGKKYAFRVRARDTSGRDLFKNQGWSETHMFQYGDACLPVVGPTAEGISARDVKVEWEADPAHSGFQVYIREATSDREWWVYTAPVRTRTIGGLKPSTTYSYRVQPLCGSVKGDLTTIYEVNTLEEGTSLPSACGVQPPLIPDGEKDSRVLLQKPLMPLDKIKIGDDIIIIVKAEQQPDGSYTGEGRLPFPFATDVFLKVKLHNAFVNEHYRVFSGSYITTYNLNSKVKGHIDDLLAELERERKKAEKEWDKNGGGGGTGPVLDTTSAPSEVIPVVGEIQDVVVSSDSTSTAGEALALAGDTGEEGPANPDSPTTGEGSSLVVESGGDRGLAGGDPPAGGGSAEAGSGGDRNPNGTDEPNEGIYDYFVTDDDAWLRIKESPYTAIKPEAAEDKLAQGLQVAVLGVVKDGKEKEVAKVKLKGSGAEEYTTLSNLTQVEKLPKEVKYRLTEDYTALVLPYSAQKADKTYSKNDHFISHKKCGIYFKVKDGGDDVLGHWIIASILRSEFFEQLLALLKGKDEMTVSEIADVRSQISQLGIEEEKGDLYLELQSKAPYKNQRDNTSPATKKDLMQNSWMTANNITTAGDIMCNLTSQAMCLSYLGIDKPCSGCPSTCTTTYSQTEDYLECVRVAKKFDDRKKSSTRNDLAKLFDIKYTHLGLEGLTRNEISDKLNEHLKKGHSVMLGGFGHMVRLQSVSDEGVTVDDPYGKMVNFTASGITAKYKKDGKDYRNGKDFGDGVGEDNFWTWDQFINQLKVIYGEAYSKN